MTTAKKAAATRPSRAQLYSRAEANLRTAHRDEFEADLARLYTENGYTYKARLTEQERAEVRRRADLERARQKVAALYAKHGKDVLAVVPVPVEQVALPVEES